MDAAFWNNRYGVAHFIYGETPNAFVAEMAPRIPAGPVLCLAEGEGRNAVHLATLGHRVTAVDQSEAGLAKARRLAAARSIEIETVVSDLEHYEIKSGAWVGIVSIFAHLPPPLRRRIHAQVVTGLRPGGVAGVVESPVYAILKMNDALAKLDTREFGGDGTKLTILNAVLPFSDQQPAMKWDGEWHITIEVFRDLGLAFAAVLVLIYVLMVGWFKSFLTPLIVMVVIPFSLIGVLPAHGILHAFFTATSMIGFMAGAGIVVRNSIILVDFIEMRLAEGHPLAESVVEAGMIRFRPIMLTALAVVAGATVIMSDPIFQGLAIALMAGSLISMFTAPVLVPLLYFMASNRK